MRPREQSGGYMLTFIFTVNWRLTEPAQRSINRALEHIGRGSDMVLTESLWHRLFSSLILKR